MNNNDVIYTVKDLIDYLQTLDPNKEIQAEYINIVANRFVNIKNRPLLKSLFEECNDHIKFKAMFY